MKRRLQALGRLLRVIAHLMHGVWVSYRHFPRLSPAQREQRIQDWARHMLELVGIELIVNGSPPQAGPVLLVANHISWLDIVVMHAARHCRFVSKAAVQRWPLVGKLADSAGTLYIERESRRDALRVVHHMAASLRAGDVLAVFPEGTTGDGTHVMPFHGNLLQAAIAVNAPVQPVALHFVDRVRGATSFAPCFMDNDSLLTSFWRTLNTPDLQAVVSYGPVQKADGRDRRVWAADLRQAVIDLRCDPALRA